MRSEPYKTKPFPEGNDILPLLETEEAFRPLAAFFAEKGIEELVPRRSRNVDGTVELVRAAFDLVLERCHGAIGALSESPIEQVFLRAVMLSFLRNSQCLIFMSPFRDTVGELTSWQETLDKLKDFTGWYKRHHGSSVVPDDFLVSQVSSGRMPPEELEPMKEWLLLYHYLPFRGAWHVSLQAKFPGLLTPRGKPRADMLFWLPAPQSIRLVVECDGFVGHRFRSTFERDRKRDRALKAKGFEVFRFSGAEINAHPVIAATELFSFLSDQEHRSRCV